MKFFARNHRNQDESQLQRAINALKKAETPHLSDNTRKRIVNEACAAIAPAGAARRPAMTPLRPLFAPRGGLTALAAVAVFGLAALVGTTAWRQGRIELPASEGVATRIEAHKDGGQVVFRIANGARTHRVARSADPADLGGGDVFETSNGAFRDRLDSGSAIVFYRID